MGKKILLGLLAAFVVIQLLPAEKNISDDQLFHVSKKYDVPVDVEAILKMACNDCHSNKTEYPWYASIQPVAWWLADHVKDGKRHLNLSNFTGMKVAFQNHKMEEIAEQVEKKEMPLASYTNFGLHSGANLSDAQRQILVKWAKTNMDSLKAWYPPDSLKMPPRPQGPPPAK
jgi:Haem-binding domain